MLNQYKILNVELHFLVHFFVDIFLSTLFIGHFVLKIGSIGFLYKVQNHMLRKYKSRDSELIGTRDQYYLNI